MTFDQNQINVILGLTQLLNNFLVLKHIHQVSIDHE